MGGRASAASKNKWNAKAYDRINLTVPKGRKDSIQAHAAALGESVNGFIGRAITHEMERDGGRGPQDAAGAPSVAGVSLPSDALKMAQAAAEAAGEAVEDFLARAVSEAAERDRLSRRAEGGKTQ